MKIFFDKGLIQNEYISFLTPLLWCPDFAIFGEDKKQIKERHNDGKKLISFSDKETCDYFVYPKYFSLEYFDELKIYSEEAKKHKKKVLVFSYQEVDDYLNVNNNIIRYKRSTNIKNPENEICLPPFPEDLLWYNNHQINGIKEGIHRKYFIWYIWYSNYSDIWSFLRYLGVRLIWIICRIKSIKWLLTKIKNERLYSNLVNAWTGNYCRWIVIQQIKKLKNYNFNFIQRKHALTTETKNHMREQYIKNLIHSDFTLLVRWFWNYSIRQYEIMSLGKIPIYIDTWAKLPFEDEINYDEIFIKVPFEDIENIEFHIDRYINSNKWNLDKIQKKIRNIYEKYFIMKNYYAKIIHNLENR